MKWTSANRRNRSRKSGAAVATVLALFLAALEPLQAHNVGYSIPSPGLANAITLDGSEGVGEWAGAHSFNIADYGTGGVLSASVKALHRTDGIYLLIAVTDSNNNNSDAIQLHFDIDHSGAPLTASDWGIEVLRGGGASWGFANPGNPDPFDSGGWAPMTVGTDFGVSPSPSSPWTAEVRLPTGAPSGLDLSLNNAGIHIRLIDIDQVLGLPSAKFTQWPQPPAMSLNDLLDDDPDQWGDYAFDPTTTFPDITVTGARNGYDGPENYRKISHTATNLFQVEVQNNSVGTVIPDATNVRLNLYLAARGIGEPWHRLDVGGVIDADCAAPSFESTLVAKSQVCSGSSSHDDVSAQNLNDVVAGTADYTVKNGSTMSRVGVFADPNDPRITVANGASSFLDVLQWNTTATQDGFFSEVMVGGTTYRRDHQCMKAEALFANDPNPADNVRQVNMDFVCVPGAMMTMLPFNIGWAGFGEYNQNQGKEMFLQLETRNMNPELGWKVAVQGARELGENNYSVRVQGRRSVPLEIAVSAPRAEAFGKTLKENLIIPPQAGGRGHPKAVIQSGVDPIHVRVEPGSVLTVTNYSFTHQDDQFVDLDGRGFLPRNGPEGLSAPLLRRFLGELGEQFQILLAPNAPLGSLVGSFDDFRTTFKVGDGAQLRVPAGKQYLSLAVNGVLGLYGNNVGTGFRVKVVQASSQRAGLRETLVPSVAAQQQDIPAVVSIRDLAPTVCIHGYESIGQKRTVDGKPYDLLRHVGLICSGILNVYPRDRSETPDKPDPKPTVTGRCNRSDPRSAGLALLLTVGGLGFVRQRGSRRRARAGRS